MGAKVRIRQDYFFITFPIFHGKSLHLNYDSIFSRMKIALKYGLMIVLIFTITHVLIHNTIGIESGIGRSIMLLNYAIYTLAILLCVVEKRKKNNGHISYGGAFGIGFFTMTVAAVILSGYQYLYLKFINHDLVLAGFNAQTSNNLFEKALKLLKKTPGGMSLLFFIGMLLAGWLISMIIAAFIKKEKSTVNSRVIAE